MKQTGTVYWAAPNSGATNSSWFTALPAGYRSDVPAFTDLTGFSYIWSATEFSANSGYYRTMDYDTDKLNRWNYNKAYGFSVRCVKNN